MLHRRTGMTGRWQDCLWAVMLAFALLMAASAPAATVHVAGSGGEAGDAFLRVLAKELGASYAVSGTADGVPDLVVVLHEGALPEARRPGVPLLVVAPESGRVELGKDESALYWAPSWTDQLRLAQYLFPSLRRVGVLLDDLRHPARIRALREQAKTMGLEVVVKEAAPDYLVRTVAELAGDCDVLIAPADSRAFNRTTIKPVLLAAYRQNRVFIGPTPAVVRAGALAALHVTPEALALEVAERIRHREKSGHWGEPSRISRFEVVTNPQVARSLGIKLPEQELLDKSWRTRGSTPWP
jgi:putative ABC transport system substrate-binding protein